MRKRVTTFLLMGALAIVPVALVANSQATKPAPAKQAKSAAAPAKSAAAPTHATRGTVKSVDDSSLVITRPGKKDGDMTFVVNASTKKEGNIAAGESVSVRYTQEGSTYTAAAITARPAKPAVKKEATKKEAKK
jgi:hypothetical protein